MRGKFCEIERVFLARYTKKREVRAEFGSLPAKTANTVRVIPAKLGGAVMNSNTPGKSLNLLEALSLVVGMIVGSGIF